MGLAKKQDQFVREALWETHVGPAQKIKTAWRKRSLRVCDDDIKAYWVCRQDAGMAVVFKCRTEHAAMEKCIADTTRDEAAFARFRDEWMRVADDEQRKLRQ